MTSVNHEAHPFPYRHPPKNPQTYNILLLEDDTEQSKLLSKQIFEKNNDYPFYLCFAHWFDGNCILSINSNFILPHKVITAFTA